jgi:hypothetical protein
MDEYVSFEKEMVKAHHLVAVLEARERHLSDRVLLVVGLLSRQEGRIGGEGEVDTREAVFCLGLDGLCHQMIHSRQQVSLELVQIDVQRPIEAKGRGDRRDNLRDQMVQVGEAGRNDAEVLLQMS